MSTTTRTSPSQSRAVQVGPVTFPRVVRAEWIKFWSLRSTYWNVAVTVLAMVAMALMMSAAATVSVDGAPAGPDGSVVIGLGYSFGQIVVAVLGALMITGEYSTGMIRSSLAAVPARVPVLVAKALIIAVVAFVLGVVGVALSYLVTYPILGADVAADLGDPEVLRIFWGSGLYMAGVGLLGLGIGALLRHSAGAIATVLGVLLLLSTIVQLLMMWSDTFTTVYPYLPSTAGEQIVTPDLGAMSMPGMPEMLDPWVGFGVLMAYVVVTLTAAAVLLRRRDA
ncbi:ABC transporter permease subunit [Georgenia sp. 10Sc9-8]|uniref:ABC transporter permease subunit n=1 Tax=Georgenia halotolerans TaxID=3028317 RepID=A0ABT5TX11_9MICO|nr:ABC transporter permease subunit [Georgenia halotolerans]